MNTLDSPQAPESKALPIGALRSILDPAHTGTASVPDLSGIPDHLLKAEYSRRFRLGRPRKPASYCCPHCDDLFTATDWRLHSRIQCEERMRLARLARRK